MNNKCMYAINVCFIYFLNIVFKERNLFSVKINNHIFFLNLFYQKKKYLQYTLLLLINKTPAVSIVMWPISIKATSKSTKN